MRAFVGIGLPLPLAEQLAEAARLALARLRLPPRPEPRPVLPADMHVTLSFLGNVEPPRLDRVFAALATLRSGPLRLQLAGIGAFPRAGILHAKIQASPGLLQLARGLFEAMERCGFPRELRPYSPHITLARLKGANLSRLAAPGHPSPDYPDHPALSQPFQASEMRLYQSLTRTSGPRYEVVRAFPFSAPPL